MLTIHFKPDFSIDNLRANNYICHFSVFSEKLLEETGLFRSEFDGSQDHDTIPRLTSRAKKIVHVPKILYYWRSHPQSVAADINAKTYAIDAPSGQCWRNLKKLRSGRERWRAPGRSRRSSGSSISRKRSPRSRSSFRIRITGTT